MKIVNIDGRTLEELEEFQWKISRKNVTCDNIKNHNKPRLYPLSRGFIFGKSQGEIELSCLLKRLQLCVYI